MSDNYSICAICDVKFTAESEPDAHYDDSGDYHYDCYQDASDREARYWSAQYRPDPFKLTKDEVLAAYEPGSAKRYAMEHELIGN